MTENTEDWDDEARIAIALCTAWTAKVRAAFACDVYLFGSAIYQSGDQFNPQSSDLDLVVAFEDELDATGRLERLAQLKDLKHELELKMIPALGRVDCVDPGVSVLPITRLEVEANIHKSGSRQFFDRNLFLNLATQELTLGLPGAATGALSDDRRQALEYVAKVRNQFLGVSANATGGLSAFDGFDPLPKDLARIAAQLIPDAAPGEWYDTRRGLEFICAEVAKRQDESAEFRALCKKISVRRGGRGRDRILHPVDLLLLAETLYDLGRPAALETLTDWAIRFAGVSPTEERKMQILEQLRRLVNDLQIRAVLDGSIIVKARSARRSFDILQLLHRHKVLSPIFDVAEIELSEADQPNAFDQMPSGGLVDRLANAVRRWKPPANLPERRLEDAFADWLGAHLSGIVRDVDSSWHRSVVIFTSGRSFEADFVVHENGPDGVSSTTVVELMRARRSGTFFRRLEMLQRQPFPSILVVVGSKSVLDSLAEDFARLSSVDAAIRVVGVTVEDE